MARTHKVSQSARHLGTAEDYPSVYLLAVKKRCLKAALQLAFLGENGSCQAPKPDRKRSRHPELVPSKRQFSRFPQRSLCLGTSNLQQLVHHLLEPYSQHYNKFQSRKFRCPKRQVCVPSLGR